MNAPVYFLAGAVAAVVAAVSLTSAPAIGAHDGGAAYVIVMGAGLTCIVLALGCLAACVGELACGDR